MFGSGAPQSGYFDFKQKTLCSFKFRLCARSFVAARESVNFFDARKGSQAATSVCEVVARHLRSGVAVAASQLRL